MGKGRPRKPSKVLKIQGTFNGSRKDTIRTEAEPVAIGRPVMTHPLAGEALKSWERTVPMLVNMGIAGESDSESLTIMCQLWGAAMASWEIGEYKAYLECVTKWLNFAGRFGMTPADRSKIIASPPKGDELDSLLKVV